MTANAFGALARRIVEDHHGYVDLESEVGVGTTFRLYLPICREAIADAPEMIRKHLAASS